jgi:branched-chain amino acid transport system substrate-binding protein
MMAEAMKEVGTEPKALTDYFNKMKKFAGVYGDISFTPENHDGYPDEQVVMVEANSLKEGAFNLAPGYGAS